MINEQDDDGILVILEAPPPSSGPVLVPFLLSSTRPSLSCALASAGYSLVCRPHVRKLTCHSTAKYSSLANIN